MVYTLMLKIVLYKSPTDLGQENVKVIWMLTLLCARPIMQSYFQGQCTAINNEQTSYCTVFLVLKKTDHRKTCQLIRTHYSDPQLTSLYFQCCLTETGDAKFLVFGLIRLGSHPRPPHLMWCSTTRLMKQFLYIWGMP